MRPERAIRAAILASAIVLPGLTSALAGTAMPAGSEAEDADLALLDVVAMTLDHDPNVAIVESRWRASQGAVKRARGAFDVELDAALERSDSHRPVDGNTAIERRTWTHSIALTRLLRGGLFLTPSVSLTGDDLADGSNEATVSFTLRQPLLRDRGRRAVAAGELAAEREVEASRLDLEHRIAERVQVVVSQYWAVRAAVLDLALRRSTEAAARDLLRTTRRLIRADVTPAAEIVQLEADVASREADRIASEGALFRARQDLGREIGLMPAEIADLSLPAETFPKVLAEELPGPPDDESWLQRALDRRADLAAARQRLEAAEIRRQAAQNGLLPALDLIFTPSYSGFEAGTDVDDLLESLYRNVPGLSTTLGVSLSWPPRNRLAEGALIEAREAVRQSALEVELATRRIGSEVPSALDAVEKNARQLVKIEQAAGLFEKALENEVKKLRAGNSTLVDVITQRDRLTAIRQQRISAQLVLALALLDLRFQTGTLTAGRGSNRDIRHENLTTLPF